MPMFSAKAFLAQRNIHQAAPAVTRELRILRSHRKDRPKFVALTTKARDTEEPFYFATNSLRIFTELNIII